MYVLTWKEETIVFKDIDGVFDRKKSKFLEKRLATPASLILEQRANAETKGL